MFESALADSFRNLSQLKSKRKSVRLAQKAPQAKINKLQTKRRQLAASSLELSQGTGVQACLEAGLLEGRVSQVVMLFQQELAFRRQQQEL